MGIRGLFLASSERMKRLSFKKLIIVPPILTYFLDLYHTNRTGMRRCPSGGHLVGTIPITREVGFIGLNSSSPILRTGTFIDAQALARNGNGQQTAIRARWEDLRTTTETIMASTSAL